MNSHNAHEELKSEALNVGPRHIAVIMDGNSRWANRHNLRTKDGHRKGAEACRELIFNCIQRQIPYLTLFAFSSENWFRSENEVRSLMALFRTIISRNEIADLHAAGTRIQFIGNRSNFSRILRDGMTEIENRTCNNKAITVTVALDYGGKWDIAQAVKKYIEKHDLATIENTNTTDIIDVLSNHLSTSHLPELDLCIRTAGERRLSNFLLWQCAYSELYFSDTFWPDFNSTDLDLAVVSFNERVRKFGR